MAATLSPLQLQAGYALFQNLGLQVAKTLNDAVQAFDQQPWIRGLQQAIYLAGTATIPNPAPPPDTTTVITPSTIASLQGIGAFTCPALGNTVPNKYIAKAPPLTTSFFLPVMPPTSPGFTGYIYYVGQNYLGNGDISKFSQMFNAAQGYVQTTNIFINSAVNAQDYLENTFSNMDNLVSGDLTQVNLDTTGFGQDLEKLGNLMNLSLVADLGFPFPLIQQVVKKGGLITPLVVALTLAGVNENIVLDLANPRLTVSDSVQKQMYKAMTLISGEDLKQILQILGVTTQKIVSQGGYESADLSTDLQSPTGLELVNVQTMADLLDPSKIFPNSFSTLTTPTCGCTDLPVLPLQPGDLFFSTRNPPGGATVYPQTNAAWNPWLNDYAVWDFVGDIFNSRTPPGGGVTPQFCDGWSEFMNTYAVWESDIFAPTFNRTYNITVPATGNYNFFTQCDDFATISIDSTISGTISSFKGPPSTGTIYLEAGTRVLNIAAENYIGPGGISLLIQTVPITSSNFDRTYTLNFPVSGYYCFTGQADNYGTFSLDGEVIFETADFIGPPGNKTLLVTQGNHTVTISGYNSGGPAGIGMTVVFVGPGEAPSFLRRIYLASSSNTPTVNANLQQDLPPQILPIFERLSRIIPFELALANQTLSVSLRQVTNLTKMTLPDLAAAFLGVETNKGLDDINNQNQPVPSDVTDYYLDQYATGTGENGTILMTDVLGTMIGTVHTAAITRCLEILSELYASGGLTALKNIYDVMQKCLDGTYADPAVPGGVDIPAGQPAAGVYATVEAAIVQLVSLANTAVDTVISTYPAQTTELNNEWMKMADQLALETDQLKRAGIVFAELIANSQVNTQGLVFALPAYGKDTTVGGTASLLEGIADMQLPGGQAIVAVLREGRSSDILTESGVGMANKLSDQPATLPPQMSTAPAKYTSAEAKTRLIPPG